MFTIPFVWEPVHNLIGIGMLYFFGMYFILFNFPQIGIYLSSKPHYIEDLDEKYRIYCIGLQNLFMSVLFGIMIDIFVTKDILNEPLINMFAIIGEIYHFLLKLGP